MKICQPQRARTLDFARTPPGTTARRRAANPSQDSAAAQASGMEAFEEPPKHRHLWIAAAAVAVACCELYAARSREQDFIQSPKMPLRGRHRHFFLKQFLFRTRGSKSHLLCRQTTEVVNQSRFKTTGGQRPLVRRDFLKQI